MRRGVTPVVAIALLMGMTVTASGGAYAWITATTQQAQEDAARALATELDIKDVRCGGGVVLAWVKNSGTADLRETTASVRVFRDGELAAVNDTDITDAAFRAAGGFGSVRVPVNVTMGRNDAYMVTVAVGDVAVERRCTAERPESCRAIAEAGDADGDGTYTVDADGVGGEEPYAVRCDMTTDGGGWTLVGAVARNDAGEPWADENTWMNASTFGTLATYGTADFKSAAWTGVEGDDIMLTWTNDSQANRIYTTDRFLRKRLDMADRGGPVSLRAVYSESEGLEGQNGGSYWQDPTQGQDQCYTNSTLSATVYEGNMVHSWKSIGIRPVNLNNKADAGMLGVTEAAHYCGNNDPDGGCEIGCWWNGDEDVDPIYNEKVTDMGTGGGSSETTLVQYIDHIGIWVR